MLKLMLPSLLSVVLSSSWHLNTSLVLLLSLIAGTHFFSPLWSSTFMSSMIVLDQMALTLIVLTLWISALMLLASYKIKMAWNSSNVFMKTVLILMWILLLSFSMGNIMSFYILFEASLIPTLLLILGWGYQPERLQASMYLMLYTVTASLPLLLSIVLLFHTSGSSSFSISPGMMEQNISIWSLFLTLAFLVKMPLYITHLWLPKAHVEAPVAGSMILAGILLKLGGYGLVRMLILYQTSFFICQLLFLSISLWGVFATAIICLRQQDMKSLIAYSSVGHMALLIGGLYSLSKWGLEGAIIMMIAHGLSSSALFALANMTYETSSSRSLYLSKGLLLLAPSMALWWFLMSAANMAAPPSLNLLGEILLLTSIISITKYLAPLLAVGGFLAAAYSLTLYTTIHHGKPSQFSGSLFLNSSRNNMTIMLHSVPLFLLLILSFSIITLSSYHSPNCKLEPGTLPMSTNALLNPTPKQKIKNM